MPVCGLGTVTFSLTQRPLRVCATWWLH